MSSSESNKAAVRDCFELATAGDFDALHEIVSDDYVLHPDEVRGVDGLTELVSQYRSAVGGLNVTIDQQFTDGDYVATRFTVRGTHDGDLMGAAPTGRKLAFSGLTISRCRDGVILEEWELVDTVGLLRQVGALAEMAAG
ncbi:MAG TPA: ester cyclase [Solirubrobacteraceae bacterium]|nr:ester cyclase [Solirubrobacteraceae bacterium]